MISLSGYNELLRAAGLPEIELGKDEAAVYMDSTFVNENRLEIMDAVLAKHPEAKIGGNPVKLTGKVQTTGVVTDYSITLSFALILPDDAFQYYTQKQYDIYVNGTLDSSTTKEAGLMQAISWMNERLSETD